MSIIQFSTIIKPIDGPMLHHVMPVPKDAVEKFAPFAGHLRIYCRFGNAREFPCALSPRGEGHCIAISKKLMKEAVVAAGQEITVFIRPDEDDGLTLPEELAEVLEQDALGSKLYNALNPGKKRGMIYYISSSKNIDTRIKRSFYMIDKLKQPS